MYAGTERNRVKSVVLGIPVFINYYGKEYTPLFHKYVGKAYTYSGVDFLVYQALNDCECWIILKENNKPIVERQSQFFIFALDNEIEKLDWMLACDLPVAYKLEKSWVESQTFSKLDLEKLAPYMVA